MLKKTRLEIWTVLIYEKYKVHTHKKKLFIFGLSSKIIVLWHLLFPVVYCGYNIISLSDEFLSDESVLASFPSQEGVSVYQRMVAFM